LEKDISKRKTELEQIIEIKKDNLIQQIKLNNSSFLNNHDSFDFSKIDSGNKLSKYPN